MEAYKLRNMYIIYVLINKMQLRVSHSSYKIIRIIIMLQNLSSDKLKISQDTDLFIHQNFFLNFENEAYLYLRSKIVDLIILFNPILFGESGGLIRFV